MSKSAPLMLDLGPHAVAVHIQTHPRSRKFSLRLLPGKAAVKVVMPDGFSPAEGLDFAARNRDWILARLDFAEEITPFAEGITIPILGEEHLIRRIDPAAPDRPRRGSVWREEGELRVLSHPEHLARRVQDYLLKQAKREISERARQKAEAIKRPLGAIRLKDTRSRWGSCSAKGNLNFSWRLIFAPSFVLDYVVAHEVAHLVHLDHSPAFWRQAEALTPHRHEAQAWLKRHGRRLLSYGGTQS